MPALLFAFMVTPAFVPATQATNSSRPDRPPGVAAASWVPITHDFGAVIERRMPDRYSAGRPIPSAMGYFTAWRDGHWLRLDSLLLHPMAVPLPPAGARWISIGQHLRFVIERQAPGQPLRHQPAGPTVLGYFAIQRDGRWLRLAPDPEGALYRGPLRPPSTSDWLPINRSLRFVIEQRAPERDPGPGQSTSVLGYFIGMHDGHWVRLGSIA